LAEVILLTFAIIHVLTGLTLFYQNFKSRPVRYAVNKTAGGRTIGSGTMPYTGILMLGFIITHLMNFHFVDKTNITIFEIVSKAFENSGYVAFYVAAVIVVAIHISHGLWSAFQTIGANHPKYMPIIQLAGIAFSIIVAIGFGFIPIYISILA
jgi:succinate dehydrogenase / fumarate reductase cytochrome b subunit